MERARLVLVTKGDLRDQRAKLERSGLEPHFDHIEIVPEKTPETYAAILARLDIAAGRFAMVGNSPRSDILPVLAAGRSRCTFRIGSCGRMKRPTTACHPVSR